VRLCKPCVTTFLQMTSKLSRNISSSGSTCPMKRTLRTRRKIWTTSSKLWAIWASIKIRKCCSDSVKSWSKRVSRWHSLPKLVNRDWIMHLIIDTSTALLNLSLFFWRPLSLTSMNLWVKFSNISKRCWMKITTPEVLSLTKNLIIEC